MEIGDRAGAFSSCDDDTIELLGYGTYEGEQVPDKEALKRLVVPNPKITLDDGRVVWGFECWWGSEEKIKKMESTRTVVLV